MDKKFVSIREAAVITGLPEYSLRQMYKHGEIAAFPPYSEERKSRKAFVNLPALLSQIETREAVSE